MPDAPEGNSPRRHPEAAFRIVDGNGVVVMPGVGEVQLLNPSGARIWELMDGSRSVTDIARTLTEEFDVTPEQALSDIEKFVDNLASHGMLA